jgi:ABC-type transporter Mla subunit MlaD
MAELTEGITGVLKKIEQMPLPEIAADLRKLVRDVDAAVLNVDTKSLGEVGKEAQQLLANLNGRVDALAPTADAAMKNADQAIVELRKFLADARPLVANAQRAAENASRLMTTANDAIDPNSPAYRELVATLREFSNSARSIRALTDDLERNPDSILFGKASARGSAR